MVLFKDIAKASSDLLTKDFPHEKLWDVEVKYRGNNPQLSSCASVTSTASVEASSSMKYSANNVNTEVKVTANEGAMLDVTYFAAKAIEGLTVGGRLERKRSSKSGVSNDSVELSCEYDNSRMHSRTMFNPLNTTFNSSLLVTCNPNDPIRIGGEVMGGVDMSALKYTVGASYTKRHSLNGKWTVGVRSLGDLHRGLDRILCNLHTTSGLFPSSSPSSSPSSPPSSFSSVGKQPSPSSSSSLPSELAVEMKHVVSEGQTGLQFGGLWYLGKTGDTTMKAKVGQDAVVAVAVSHRFSNYATGVLGMQLNTMEMSKADSVKYGFKLYCKA